MSELNRRNFLRNATLASGASTELKPMLTHDELDYLRRFDTPTVANALERGKLPDMHGRSRLEGVMTPKIRCIFPELGITNGYAATATIRASRPRGKDEPYTSRTDYWKYIDSIPKPTIIEPLFDSRQ